MSCFDEVIFTLGIHLRLCCVAFISRSIEFYLAMKYIACRRERDIKSQF